MRNLSKWLFWMVLALPLVAVVALALAVEGAQRVGVRDDVSPADVDRAVAMAWLHDPRRAPTGALQTVSFHERDVDLLVQHAARRWLAADARVKLQPGKLLVEASLAAPLGRWLNIELGLRETAELPEVDRLRVGRLPLPTALVAPVLRAFGESRGVHADAILAVDWIEHVTIGRERMTVSYRIGPETADRLRAALIAPADQLRLRAYTERLAILTRRAPGDRISIEKLLAPLIALAADRTATGGDAVEENRAALLTLTFFANHRPLGQMVPAAYSWAQPRPLHVTMQQRYDLALHFLISAVIAAEAGTPLADAVGLWKELADARRGGSGFSFSDLAADRAGTRFGELAVRDPTRLQAHIAANATESHFMPEVRDLPEYLPEAEFVARYGGVGGAAYRRMLADIAARIEALPVFR